MVQETSRNSDGTSANSADRPLRPERALIAPGLEASRIVTGLWQMADQERDGRAFDREAAVEAIVAYAGSGFDTFDMANHYGSAEEVAGEAARRLAACGNIRPRILTKWVPAPAPMTREAVAAGIGERSRRLGGARIDLMQFHWWLYRHPA